MKFTLDPKKMRNKRHERMGKVVGAAKSIGKKVIAASSLSKALPMLGGGIGGAAAVAKVAHTAKNVMSARENNQKYRGPGVERRPHFVDPSRSNRLGYVLQAAHKTRK